MQKEISKKKIKIRKARSGDIDTVLKIGRESTSGKLKAEGYRTELSNKISNFYIAHLPESNRIIGYVIFWIIEDILEIHHFGVKRVFQQTGVGSSLIQFLLKKASKKGVRQIFLEVRESNKPAIRIYTKFGFKKCGIRKKYYLDPVEDAFIFSRLVHEDNQ